MHHSLVTRALGTNGMNVKILADSKSHLEDVLVHFNTHTKCFPRSPNPILANHPHSPMDLGCHVFWSSPKGCMTKMSTWLSLAPCAPYRSHPPPNPQPPANPRFRWVLEVIATPSQCILEVRLFVTFSPLSLRALLNQSCYSFSRET